jgi:hypothetical protein
MKLGLDISANKSVDKTRVENNSVLGLVLRKFVTPILNITALLVYMVTEHDIVPMRSSCCFRAFNNRLRDLRPLSMRIL